MCRSSIPFGLILSACLVLVSCDSGPLNSDRENERLTGRRIQSLNVSPVDGFSSGEPQDSLEATRHPVSGDSTSRRHDALGRDPEEDSFDAGGYSSTDPPINLQRGLIAHYSFDGHAKDYSPNLSQARVSGPKLTYDRNGIFGLAYEFDGDDDFIDIGNDPRVKPRFPVSISIWVRIVTDANFVGYSIFTNNFDNQRNHGFWLAVTSTARISMNYGNGGPVGSTSRFSKTGTTRLRPGDWYHVVATAHSEDEMSIYIDGLEDGGFYSGGAESLKYSDGHGRFGVRDSGVHFPPLFFEGSMDDMRMYNRALTEDEIQIMYLARKK